MHGVDILVTEAESVALDGRFRRRAMPPLAVKGVSGVVATLAIEGFEEARA